MQEIHISRLELQRWSLKFLFPFLKYIFGFWDWGLGNSFWDHVIEISIGHKNFNCIFSQLLKSFVETFTPKCQIVIFEGTIALIKKKRKLSSYIKGNSEWSSCKVVYKEGLLIYEEMRKYFTLHKEAVSHICMTLQLLHSEFPYIWGKFDFLFYRCMHVKYGFLYLILIRPKLTVREEKKKQELCSNRYS